MLIGPAPVLAHGQVAVKVEMIDQFAHHMGMLVDPVAEPGRAFGQPETEVIGCDAAELIAQAGDDVAVEEAPRRVADEEHDDGT
jgi:hypothetical protein